MRNEQRHARAVLALIEELLRLEIAGIEIHLWLAKHPALSVAQIEPVNGSRHRETGEAVEGFRVRPLPGETARRADARQFEFARQRAIARINLHPALRILEKRRDELVVDHVDALQCFGGLRNDFHPVRAVRIPGVDDDTRLFLEEFREFAGSNQNVRHGRPLLFCGLLVGSNWKSL